MDFRFDPEERSLIQQAAEALSARLAPERLTSGNSTRAAWTSIAVDGWLHAGIDEGEGGGGLSPALSAAVAREAGRLVAGDAFMNNAVLIPRLLLAARGPDGLLDHVEHPGFLLCDGRTDSLRSNAGEPTDWCFGVEDGLDAYRLTDDGRLLRYPDSAWTLRPAGRHALAVGEVETDEAGAEQLGTVADFPALALAAAQTLHAAGLVGCGERALRMTVDHVLIREQFGVVIGGFQAIKHGLADVAVRLETAWNATLYASLRPLDPTGVATSRLQAVTASEQAVRVMTQFHGGIAVTSEHPAHLYLKTAQTGRWRFGAPDDFAYRIATTMLGLEATA